MHKITHGVSNLVSGHVLDVSKKPLESALRRYDPQLYLKWNPKKRKGLGIWELRRKPEMKSALAGRSIDTPTKGLVYVPGDIFDMGDYTISVPKYNENHTENHVKDFEYLTYDILAWVSKHDGWQYGFRGKDLTHESDYREGKYLDKIDDDAQAERSYMIKQHRTEFNDFREYVLSGGDPYRLMDYWGK